MEQNSIFAKIASNISQGILSGCNIEVTSSIFGRFNKDFYIPLAGKGLFPMWISVTGTLVGTYLIYKVGCKCLFYIGLGSILLFGAPLLIGLEYKSLPTLHWK